MTDVDSAFAELPPLRSHAIVLQLIVLGTLARIVLAATIGLGVDESYAVTVSRRLSLSYFDHPPLSFWIPAVLAKMTGSENAVLLRLPFILLFAGTTWMVYRLGARLFGERAGALAALLINLSPVFSLTAGGWILPDGPLFFWLVAASLCLERVLISRDVEHPTRWWIAAGACTGLALLSKYHGVFVPLGVGFFLLTSREQRRWLRHPGPYLALAVAAICFLPVIVWNAEHDWASFRFQLARGTVGHLSPVAALAQNLGGQVGYLLPWIWLPLVWVLVSALRGGPRDERRWLLACLAIGPIALFTLVSLGGNPGLPHWPSPGYLVLFPMLGAAVDARLVRRELRTRRWIVGSAFAFALLAVIAASQTATGWITELAPSLFARGDPTLEALDWRELAPALAADAGALRSHRAFVAAPSWVEAGKAGYALGPDIDVICLCAEPHQFRYLYADSFTGRNAVIVERVSARRNATALYASSFRAVGAPDTITIHRAGRPALRLTIRRATSLSTLPYASATR